MFLERQMILRFHRGDPSHSYCKGILLGFQVLFCLLDKNVEVSSHTNYPILDVPAYKIGLAFAFACCFSDKAFSTLVFSIAPIVAQCT